MVEICWDNSPCSSWKSKTLPLAHYPSHFYQYFLKSLYLSLPQSCFSGSLYPNSKKMSPLKHTHFPLNPWYNMGAVVSPSKPNTRTPLTTKMALRRSCVVGPCGLTCSNATSRCFCPNFGSQAFWKGGCRWKNIEKWWVWFPKFSTEEVRKKKRKFDNTVPYNRKSL